MINYAIKTAYGEQAAKRVRIFKLSPDAMINSENRGSDSVQNTDKDGQSVITQTRAFPTISSEGALTFAGPLNIEFAEAPVQGEVILDFPTQLNRPLAFCKSEDQLKVAVNNSRVRMVEVEIWSNPELN